MSRPWLVVVDPQRVFADAGSPWGSPMSDTTVAEVRVAVDACAGSTPENHRRALAPMALYDPQVSLV